eukprot:TRINITY_DN100899_c0_g1_i1.p1 TRINITY_DN100899_c0_g1~~TRINITY_DN100899_c0_g1_i1.p1  ORF type:complete len:623 (-),score=116.79 TRINITY_DN100899_c0_g1_i1:220-2088(-)
MEATVRLSEAEATVAVQVLWRSAEINLLREKQEPLERFLVRLGLSCGRHVSGGGDKKRNKKEKKKPIGTDGQMANVAQTTSGGLQVSLLGRDGAAIKGSTPVAEALQIASHVEIEGERLPVNVNPPTIKKLEVFGKPLAGCPLVASVRCEFCDASALKLRWVWQAEAGDAEGEAAGEGRVFQIPATGAIGRQLVLKVTPKEEGAAIGGPKTLRVGLVEESPSGWPERRVQAFQRQSDAANCTKTVRVATFNILAAPYAKTQTASREMYPYCAPGFLDFEYRQPLLGRELQRLDADIVCLQECQYSTYTKFLSPIFGKDYHIKISLKASQVSEGCVVMARRSVFEVLEEREAHFRNFIQTEDAFRHLLREVKAKWPNFIEGVLPNLSTVFQVLALKHRESGQVVVAANTHLFFHPGARHIRLLQVNCLLHMVQEMRAKHAGDAAAASSRLPRVILCGDLNCMRDTAALQHVMNQEVPSDHADWKHALQFVWEKDGEAAAAANDDNAAPMAVQPRARVGSFDEVAPLPAAECQPGVGLTLKPPLPDGLVDAYAKEGGSESLLPFTNYVAEFQGVLDYILFSSDKFRVSKLLDPISEADLTPHGGLPNELFPSDHLSIAADLEIV